MNAMVKLIVGTILVGAGVARAEIKMETIEYKDGETALEGVLAYDEAVKEPRPLVLVVHEWWGLNEYAKSRAKQLAGMGYTAFAVDMYGKGVVTTDPKRAAELAGPLRKDRAMMRRRIAAALEALKGNARVDAGRVAAIGYCFGGTVALELARSGAALAGVVSFHGGLDTPAPADAANIKGKVLVCTGADDKAVPITQVAAFADEMRAGKVDYQINIYGHAVHAFTNPASGNNPSTNVAYNENADKRSWEALKAFLAEVLK
ncbi:MAG: dienelactone hydrolase family protein [Planctomycetota bacterium]|nr:dienelactone hydrolase family protein [Planctomycetota bacterium]